MIDQVKLAIRRNCRSLRKALPANYQQASSLQVCEQILALKQYHQAHYLALYQAKEGEINLHALWQAASLQGKICYFPVLNEDKTLVFLPATLDTAFSDNCYGIAEPKVNRENAIAVQNLDIIFLPIVAFDERGTRLGMGAGYYDRTLEKSTKEQLLIGVAYEFQRQPYLKAESWDVPLTAIVTPETIYWSKV